MNCLSGRAFGDDVIAGIESEMRGLFAAIDPSQIRAILESERGHTLFYDDMLRAAKRSGFSLSDSRDVSANVQPFFSPFMKRVRELMALCRKDDEIRSLLAFAISFATRRQQFENGSLRYSFLELKKGSG